MCGTPEYYAWNNMIQRCYNKNCPVYYQYGGRGIEVCEEWKNSFIEFFKHVGKRPSKKLSLDRIKNEKGYFPGNVHWATRKQQHRNRRAHFAIENFATKVLLDELTRRGVVYKQVSAFAENT